MPTHDEEFIKRLWTTFRVEADEHLHAISSGLLELERSPSSDAALATIVSIYREAHTLKGAARAVDFQNIESLCQRLEETFSAWKRRQAIPPLIAFDALHKLLDMIRARIDSPEPGQNGDVQRQRDELKVVPILNVTDVMKSARPHGPPQVSVSAPADEPSAAAKRVLVVDDSIIPRMLLKKILESAGYCVKTAVDGIDAFTALREDQFDLVVSDVEMPRMDGLVLTSRIRADKHLGAIPVVLVTALESREQREHGIDAGANAYVVKSNVDQGNLLEVVRAWI